MSPESKTWVVQEPYLRVGGKLLEGPAYDPDHNKLWWVDIRLDCVHCISLAEGPESLRTFSVEGNTVGTIAMAEGSDDLLLVGAKYGFATFNTTSGEIVGYCSYHEKEMSHAAQRRLRANDGGIDVRGRIFQGILLDDKLETPGPEGMLISLDLDGQIHRVVDNVTCPNGLGWDSTNTIMYWAESFSGNVYKFDYDIEAGNVTGQTVFFHVEGHEPENNLNAPDGLVVDEEDHIWLAVWGGSEVLRITPEGRVVGRIELPTRFVTSLVFVGTELFITTAEERAPVDCPGSAEYGGHLYRVDVSKKGLPKYSGHLPQPLGISAQIQTSSS